MLLYLAKVYPLLTSYSSYIHLNHLVQLSLNYSVFSTQFSFWLLGNQVFILHSTNFTQPCCHITSYSNCTFFYFDLATVKKKVYFVTQQLLKKRKEKKRSLHEEFYKTTTHPWVNDRLDFFVGSIRQVGECPACISQNIFVCVEQ